MIRAYAIPSDVYNRSMLHIYIDRTNEGVPFYVGMGDESRVRLKRRNKHHSSVARKHGLVRTIVESHETREAAALRETELIAELHTFVDDPLYNGLGCNYTKGGEGCSCDEGTRQKISDAKKAAYAAGRMPWNKGKSAPVKLSDEERERRRQLLANRNRRIKPMLGRSHTDESRAKMKRPHRCSICTETGHTKTTCPQRPADAVNNVQIAQKNRYRRARTLRN